jgi:hypothetical protein
MKILSLLALMILVAPAFSQAQENRGRAARPNRLVCKTGPEKRAVNQPLRLYFQYNVPFLFEPEDPTMPFGRQVFVLGGRPVMQLFFEKATGPAGENGENLQPMQCAFMRRAVRRGEPSQVQILTPGEKMHWITQQVGQKTLQGGLSLERATIAPAGDWAFSYQFEKVFVLDIDDMKNFVTSQLPKPLN